MPLNYSKWDQLELSDDSDIEGHPNVDKRSLIRWKQRDIHEKRELRKQRIKAYRAEIDCNRVLAPRLDRIRDRFEGSLGQSNPSQTQWAEDSEEACRLTGLPFYQHLVERLLTCPSSLAPPTNSKNQPTYDAMILSLLQQMHETVKSLPSDEQEKGLLNGLKHHIAQIAEHTLKLQHDLENELSEQQKHITSDDIKEGFENKYVPAKPEPPPISHAVTKPSEKKQVTTYEVLNPEGSSSNAPSQEEAHPEDDEGGSGAELPEITPDLETFSRLPLWAYETSFRFIQEHRDVVVPGASDALLVAAFRAQSEGQVKYAEQCVHQSLLLQYCDKLGKDGVRVFFKKMMTDDKRATAVFVKDVKETYAHLVGRVEDAAASQPVQREQIQLVPENPNAEISFNVPDGPPPDDLRLEGPGTENLDLEEVRKALTLRWTVFQGFSEPLKDALKTGKLEAVNKVLGEMEVSEAEDVVSKLNLVGILSFADGGIRDETGNTEEDEETQGAE